MLLAFIQLRGERYINVSIYIVFFSFKNRPSYVCESSLVSELWISSCEDSFLLSLFFFLLSYPSLLYERKKQVVKNIKLQMKHQTWTRYCAWECLCVFAERSERSWNIATYNGVRLWNYLMTHSYVYIFPFSLLQTAALNPLYIDIKLM